MRKVVLISVFVPVIFLGASSYALSHWNTIFIDQQTVITPLAEIKEKPKPLSPLEDKEVLNVLLIGVDRRSKFELGFNTDTMILVSLNPKTHKVLLTSVPRDLWINGNKINALYTVNGPESLIDAFKQISGQDIDGNILTDFFDFKWVVDSFGGVSVDVERTFTDYTFPNDTDTDIVTVTFTEGIEVLDGDRALTFARSRKGTNGEGSDLMRAKRQHLLLQGLVEAVNNPENVYKPFDIKTFFEAVTSVGRMKTTLSLYDALYLWDFYKDREQYEIESFVVGDDYIYHPGTYPESAYSAWVFVPRDPLWEQLHLDIESKLDGTFVEETKTLSE
ncbi:MAG: Cell envelope-related transcriptional attenuator domain containing protein [candidate division WWE3 bacterium GW2011_GWA1_41_8]|uniref:Cell envelope-related transcriptional attenuator domain containing protein n=2 Tax=Katanobacteria TaxID=422282 RepID=A0A0G1A6K1_UNCKA|nr:MAG: Cell envelope-related transcriptional attenuator domain containing protein [candidate division WWE3 bacterium GW2011_GWB1_41_6]KKS20963.1 MAG: Cell envelope-related transcriptional attenuator domain containing protein [candidate division WWE3 bacterium GW2011_GWA1_41_8]